MSPDSLPRSARIASLSLGSSARSRTEEKAFAAAAAAGVLSIAAAGNDGNKRTSYPAGYASVVSVAAVDANLAHASFSQVNKDVELSAPGVAVFSTVPVGQGLSSAAAVAGTTYPSNSVEFSGMGVRGGEEVVAARVIAVAVRVDDDDRQRRQRLDEVAEFPGAEAGVDEQRLLGALNQVQVVVAVIVDPPDLVGGSGGLVPGFGSSHTRGPGARGPAGRLAERGAGDVQQHEKAHRTPD